MSLFLTVYVCVGIFFASWREILKLLSNGQSEKQLTKEFFVVLFICIILLVCTCFFLGSHWINWHHEPVKINDKVNVKQGTYATHTLAQQKSWNIMYTY